MQLLGRRERMDFEGDTGLKTPTRRCAMAIRLDHTIVPAKDKIASAVFFAEIFGLAVQKEEGEDNDR
jgi:hypothetical protein